MLARPLRIGIMGTEFLPGTGPGSYFAALEPVFSGRHLLCHLSGSAGPSELDLVHVIDAKRVDPHQLGSLSAPVIADFHDDYWVKFEPYLAPDLPLRWLRQKQLRSHHLEVIKRVAAVVAHSEAVARSIRGVIEGLSFESEPPAVHFVPYGVNIEETKPSPEPEKPSGPLILMVGRDLFRKGFPVIVRALKIMLATNPDARLVVIGHEYWHSRAAARLLARGLPIRFLGGLPRDQVLSWYRKASVLAQPSRQEAFGIVLLEALAAGLPVVAADVGGISEAVEHERSGLLHRPGDAKDLSDKLKLVIEDPALRERLIQGGRKQVMVYSIQNMAAKLEAVYKSVAGPA